MNHGQIPLSSPRYVAPAPPFPFFFPPPIPPEEGVGRILTCVDALPPSLPPSLPSLLPSSHASSGGWAPRRSLHRQLQLGARQVPTAKDVARAGRPHPGRAGGNEGGGGGREDRWEENGRE
jgi:hypothetical protein